MSPPTAARIVVAGAVLVLAIVTAAPALAQSETVGGRLVQRSGNERSPVPGVTILVSQDGAEVGSAVSHEDGVWEVALPGPGTYLVTLDVSTLPEGISLSNPDRAELMVSVTQGQSRPVAFPLGEGVTVVISTWSRVGSLFVVGLKLGAIISLSAVGLSLIFGVTGLVNFSHAELVSLGGVIAYGFHALGPRWPLAIAAIPALAALALLGYGQDRFLWRPLRHRGMSLLSMMVVSIGLGFALRHIILIFFGGLPRAFPGFAGQPAVAMFGLRIVPKQLVTIAVAAGVLTGVAMFLQRTRAGTALRAVRDDPDLAESSGIDVDRVIALTWTVGAALAALGGIFFGLTESVQWDMGFNLLLLMFAAVVLGGLGSAYGAMLGGFVVGVAVEMSTLVFPTELKGAVGLALLIVMLIFRPQGLLGVRGRIG